MGVVVWFWWGWREGCDGDAAGGGEGEPVGGQGVAGEGEVPAVQAVVVVRAQGQVGLVVGAAAVGPGVQVVDLDEPVGGAAGVAAAAVAVVDEAAGAVGHDALGASDADGVDRPRVFRTARRLLFHAACNRSRYSSWTSCGVLYPSPEWRRLEL